MPRHRKLLLRAATLLAAAGLAVAGMAAAAETDEDFFDLLARQPYRSAFATLTKPKSLPDWVHAILAKGEGTATAPKAIGIAGTSYRLDHVCKLHDCAANALEVLWRPNGATTWGALVANGKSPVMLGNPPADQAKALTDALAAAPK